MKKTIVKLASIAAITCFTASVALAQGHIVKVTVDCPDIGTKGTENVTNYGTYLAGNGLERVNGDAATRILFEAPIAQGANIPVDLPGSGYYQASTSYNPSNGAVLCYYSSSMGFDTFALAYMMTNALNGIVVGSGVDEIHIRLPVGLN